MQQNKKAEMNVIIKIFGEWEHYKVQIISSAGVLLKEFSSQQPRTAVADTTDMENYTFSGKIIFLLNDHGSLIEQFNHSHIILYDFQQRLTKEPNEQVRSLMLLLLNLLRFRTIFELKKLLSFMEKKLISNINLELSIYSQNQNQHRIGEVQNQFKAVFINAENNEDIHYVANNLNYDLKKKPKLVDFYTINFNLEQDIREQFFNYPSIRENVRKHLFFDVVFQQILPKMAELKDVLQELISEKKKILGK